MLEISLNMYHAVALGAFLFWLGGVITSKSSLLNRYCIPAPLVGGLCFSQLVTLYITPVYYAYMEDFSRWLTRRFGQRFEANRAARAEHEKEEGSHAG